MADNLETSVVTKTTPMDVEASLGELKGAFVDSLRRNNKQIKSDRALAIAEDTQMTFKRVVEDLERDIKKLKRQRDAKLDLSPVNTQSLIPAADFDATAFVNDDLQFGINIRNMEIRLDIAKERYEYLFGKL